MRNLAQTIQKRTAPAPQKQFVTYVRTLQWYRSRLRKIEAEEEPIYIPSKFIEERFFPYPIYNRKKEIEKLINEGQISLSKQSTKDGREIYKYKALMPGEVNLASLARKYEDDTLDDLHKTMRTHLMNASLKENAPSTEYFNVFLEFRKDRPDLFFIVDAFAKRIHTPVSNFNREYRPNIMLYGQETTSLDVCTMQPLLLGKILRNSIGANEFSQWIDDGQDVYIMLQMKAGLQTRDDGKKRFFEILFAPKNNDLSTLFGHAKWIEWINDYKGIEEPKNPNSKKKNHSNLAWLLQTTEVKIMKQVWQKLVDNDIPFLSVHDEILSRQSDQEKVFQLFHSVFEKEFSFFKINTKEANIINEFETFETYIKGLYFKDGILINGHGYPATWDTTSQNKHIDQRTKEYIELKVNF